MPVILEPEHEDIWLKEDDPGELKSVLDPFKDENTKVFPVSKKVNNASYDSPDVIEPVDLDDQSSLGQFS